MARLSILSLGTLQITLDATPLASFDSDKARALLTFLAVESDRAHRRETLAGMFWPEHPERRARHSLSQALSNVREAIGDRERDASSQFLYVTHHALQFRRTSDYWLDVEQLVLSHQARPSAGASQQSLAVIDQAISLYRGPFLDGFSLRDSPAFEEWALLQRERLERVAMALFVSLVEAYTQRGAYDRALHYAWRQLDLDPWREDAHRHVIRLLAWSGQRSAALRQYDACCRILAEELDVAPEAETTGLYERIVSGTLGQPPQLAPIVPRLPAVPRHNLPAQITPLVGREAELAAVQVRLEQPACRLLTLTGPGGIGKTRLAIEVARHQLAGFPDGVFLVTLASLSEPDALIPAIAQAIGLSLSDQGGPQAQQLRNHLRERALLLLLDNAEHLVEVRGASGGEGGEDDLAARQSSVGTVVSAILAAAPGVKVLVTSRVRLNVLGEHVVPVDALVYPDESAATAEAVAHLPSVQLFVQSAQRVLPSFALNETTCAAVAGICRCVEGHPLALLLTARWITTLPVTEIAAALADHGPGADWRRLDMLRANWRNAPGRHRSLRAVFEHSWRLLSPRERPAFEALAVFRGGFTRTAAQDVAGALPRDLRVLVDASLLRRASSGRYRMHELLRQYGAEKLSCDPVAARGLHLRYCTYYADALTAWAEDAKGPRQQVMLDEMDEEIDNARAAWDWAVEAEELAFIDQAVQGLSLYYARRVRRQEGADACRAAATQLEALIATEPSNQGEVMRVLSRVLQRYGWFHLAERRLEAAQRSLAVLDEPGLAGRDVRSERAGALRSLGDLLMETDRRGAEQHYIQSLDLYRALSADWEQAQVLDDLGWCAWHVNSLEKARGFLEEALSLARALGDVRTVSDAMMGLSGVALSSGELPEAARLSEELLALRRELGYPHGVAGALYSLGIKRTMLAQLPEAISLHEECIRIRRDQLGLPVPYEVSVLAWAEMYAGFYDRAERHARTAYETMGTRGDARGLGWTQLVLGGVLLGQERFEEAEGVLQASLEAHRPLQQWLDIAGALALLGYARCMQGRLKEARRDLAEALRVGTDVGAVPVLGFIVPGFALLSARKNDPERAVELYASASCFPLVAETQWFADVVGRHIDAAAADLPPDAVAEARGRGRARDLHATVEELLAALDRLPA